MTKFKAENWEPINNWLLVEVDKVEDRTAGGILLPENMKEKDQFSQAYGTILKMSPDAFPSPEFTKKPAVGARISFDHHGGKFADDAGMFRFIPDIDIIAIQPTNQTESNDAN